MTDTQHETHGEQATVACDGGKGALGHPKVYLTLSDDGTVTCPYCSKQLTKDDVAE